LLRAKGSVHLRIGNEDTYAADLIYNLDTKKGLLRDGVMYNEPWYYQGKEILKVEEKESMVENGMLMTCSLKYPHFYFQARKIIVHIDKELIAKHVVLRIGGIPLLYLPVYRRDLRKGKRARIIVKLGTDSYQGHYMNVILPVVRRQRYDGVLLYDYTTRRGMGWGSEGKYDVKDVNFKEILLKIPEDATLETRKDKERLAEEIRKRLRGEFNKYRLKQIFLEYKISEEDITRAENKAKEVHAKATAEGASFAELARQESDDQKTKYKGGDLGFITPGDDVLEPELEDAAFQLQPGQVSDVIKTEKGYNILKVEQFMDEYGTHEIRVRHIKISIKPSDETQKTVQTLAKQIHEQLTAEKGKGSRGQEGIPQRNEADTLFEDLVQQHSDDAESKAKGGDIGWVGLNDMESRQRYAVRDLKPNDISKTVETDQGIHIFKMLEKEDNPTFEELARKYSEGEEAKEGGEKGFRAPWDDARPVSREAARMNNGEVSDVIATKKDYRIIKVEQKRTYNGNLYFYTSDLFSYERKGSYKIGRRYELWHSHRHMFYTPWDYKDTERGELTFAGRGLTFMGRTQYFKKSYDEGYYGTPRAELRTYGTFTWGSALSVLKDLDRIDPETGEASETGALVYPSNILARLTIDKAVDLTTPKEERTGVWQTQKLPELTISWSGLRLAYFPGLRKVNSYLRKIAKKVKTEKVPILGFPTLDDIRLDLDGSVGNYFKDQYTYYHEGESHDEENIYLQSANLGFEVQKQSTIEFWPGRELRLDLGLNGNVIWHDKDRLGERNIIQKFFTTSSSLRNTLFRVYDISFIPNTSKLRHQIVTSIRYDRTPDVAEKENLYTFGPSAYIYERNKLLFDFETDMQIKLRRGDRKFTLFSFDTGWAIDYSAETSEYSYYRRKYDYIRSRFTITPLPSRNLRININTTHDPEEEEEGGRRFKMTGFQGSMNYSRGTYVRGWRFNFGNSYYEYYSGNPSRTIFTGFNLRPSRKLEIDVNIQYDWIKKDFYSQRITFRRNLHCWDLRLTWRQIGTTKKIGDTVIKPRRDFTFQINLIADPSATIGLGYDATTETWGIQSLPVGVPYGAFGTGRIGRSYF